MTALALCASALCSPVVARAELGGARVLPEDGASMHVSERISLSCHPSDHSMSCDLELEWTATGTGCARIDVGIPSSRELTAAGWLCTDMRCEHALCADEPPLNIRYGFHMLVRMPSSSPDRFREVFSWSGHAPPIAGAVEVAHPLFGMTPYHTPYECHDNTIVGIEGGSSSFVYDGSPVERRTTALVTPYIAEITTYAGGVDAWVIHCDPERDDPRPRGVRWSGIAVAALATRVDDDWRWGARLETTLSPRRFPHAMLDLSLDYLSHGASVYAGVGIGTPALYAIPSVVVRLGPMLRLDSSVSAGARFGLRFQWPSVFLELDADVLSSGVSKLLSFGVGL